MPLPQWLLSVIPYQQHSCHGCTREDRRIKRLREGIECDAADICARLLSHNPASSSVSMWALGVVQSMLQSKVEEMAGKEHGQTDHDGSERVLSVGRAQCTCSSSSAHGFCHGSYYVKRSVHVTWSSYPL